MVSVPLSLPFLRQDAELPGICQAFVSGLNGEDSAKAMDGQGELA